MLVCELDKEKISEVNPRSFEEKRYFRNDQDYPLCPIESIRTYGKKPFRLDKHIKRLLRSAEAIGKPLPGGILRFIREWIFKIIEEAPFDPQFLRITATPNKVLIVSRELEIDPTIYEGVEVMAAGLKREDNIYAKTANRETLEKAYKLAEARGDFECLLVNRKGEITEGTRSNVLWVRRGTLYWCPYALEGITQEEVIRLAESQEIPIPVQRNYQGGLHLNDLDYVQEIFLTQTSRGIVPVTRINNRKIGTGEVGPVTYLLMEKFKELITASCT